MFVRSSTYQEMKLRAYSAELKLSIHEEEFRALARKWGNLVRRINALGGEPFLEKSETIKLQSQFTQEEIQRLLMLCHPDKHDGKPMATEMTAKLLKLKEKMK